MGAYDNAINQIESAKSLADITTIVEDYSATATGSGGVLYSGKVNGLDASAIANRFASDTGVSILDGTARGGLLSAAQEAILNTATNIFEIAQGLDTQAAMDAAQTFLFGGARGTAYKASNIASSLWGQASNEFASTLSGNVTIIGTLGEANPLQTLDVVELPVLLNNSAVTSIGGVATSSIRAAGSNAKALIPKCLERFESRRSA